MASLREVGQRLKQAREAQGLSLEEIATRTRITVRHLLALEEGNETDLPEVFYIRGFLKKYAEAVGLAPNDVADAYRTAPIPTAITPDIRPGVGPIAYYLVIIGLLGGVLALAWHFQPRVSVVDDPTATATPAAPPSPAAASPSPAPAIATASPSPSVAPTPSATAAASPTPAPGATPSSAAAASPAARPTAEAQASPSLQPSPDAKPSPSVKPSPTAKPSPSVKPSPAAKPSPSVKASPSPRPTSLPSPSPADSPAVGASPAAATEAPPASPRPTTKPTAKPTPTPPKQVTVRLDFVERSWVEVLVDGRLVFEGVLSRGSQRQFKGKRVEVSAGNSGGVRITANGRDKGRMGQHGVVVTRTYHP